MGDTLRLRECAYNYTGRAIIVDVTYVLDQEPYAPDGYVVLGLRMPVKKMLSVDVEKLADVDKRKAVVEAAKAAMKQILWCDYQCSGTY